MNSIMNLHFLPILLVLCFPASGLEDTYSAASYSEDEEAPVFPLSNSQGFYNKKSSYNKTYNYKRQRHSYGDAKPGYGTYNGDQQHNSKPSYGGSYAAQKPDYSAPNPSYKSHQSYGGVKPSYGGSYAAQKPDYSAPKPSYKSHQSYGGNRDINKKRYGTGHYNYAGGHDSYSGEQNKNDYSGQKPGYNYEHEYGQGVKYSSHSSEHHSGENGNGYGSSSAEEDGSEDDKQPKDYDGEKPNHGPAYPAQQQPVIRNQPINPAGVVPPPIYPLYGMPPYTNYYPLYYFPTPEQQEKISEILTGKGFLKVKPEEATTTQTQSSTTKMGTQKSIQLPTTQEKSTSTASPTQVITNSLASSTPTLSSTLATVARLEETTTTQTQSSTTKKTSTSTATPTQVTESTNPTTTISTDAGTSTTSIITSALIKDSSGNSSFGDSAALANGLASSPPASVPPPVQTSASKSGLPAKRGFAPAAEDNSLPVTVNDTVSASAGASVSDVGGNKARDSPVPASAADSVPVAESNSVSTANATMPSGGGDTVLSAGDNSVSTEDEPVPAAAANKLLAVSDSPVPDSAGNLVPVPAVAEGNKVPSAGANPVPTSGGDTVPTTGGNTTTGGSSVPASGANPVPSDGVNSAQSIKSEPVPAGRNSSVVDSGKS